MVDRHDHHDFGYACLLPVSGVGLAGCLSGEICNLVAYSFLEGQWVRYLCTILRY